MSLFCSNLPSFLLQGKAKVLAVPTIWPLTSLAPISSPPSLCSSHTDLPAISQVCQAHSCLRAFELAMPPPGGPFSWIPAWLTRPPDSSIWVNVIFSLRPTLLLPVSYPLLPFSVAFNHLLTCSHLLICCCLLHPNVSSMGPRVSVLFITASLVPRAESGIKQAQQTFVE